MKIRILFLPLLLAAVAAFSQTIAPQIPLKTSATGEVKTPVDAATFRAANGLALGTNVQAFDSDLSAIASLATTSFGRSALTLADAAAARTLYGLVIGTNVQAFDSDLAAIAALATTSFGRSFLTLADAADARALLALGTAATSASTAFDASGAATAAQAFAIQRANHTGAQAWSTITGTPTSLFGYGIELYEIAPKKIVMNTGTNDDSGIFQSFPDNAAADIAYQISGKGSNTLLIDARGAISSTNTITALSFTGDGSALAGVTHAADLNGYQPLNSGLTAISALSTTSFGRSFLPLADAAAGRTLLGLGSAATAASTAFEASGAAATAQAFAIQRANHTGTQTLATISDAGTAAAHAHTEYATAAQGALAASAVQPAGLTKAAVGLGNVDNTSDANKPVSTAQATAIALAAVKTANLSDLANVATARTNLGLGTAATTAASAYATAAQGATADAAAVASTTTNALALKAPLASPAFTGTVTAAAITASGAVTGSNLSGTNSGDQTLPTASTLAGTTLAGGITASSLLSAGGGNFGTAAFTAVSAYATAAQGTLASSALQPSGSAAALTALNATQLTSGTVPAARLAATTGVRYVAKNGNDGTALLGQITAPYLTIQAALTAASSGETVEISAGNYDEAVTLKVGVPLFYRPGATMISTTISAVLNITSGTGSYRVSGNGVFRGVNTALSIGGSVGGSTLELEADEVQGSYCGMCAIDARIGRMTASWGNAGAATHKLLIGSLEGSLAIPTGTSASAKIFCVSGGGSGTHFYIDAHAGTIEHWGSLYSTNSDAIHVEGASTIVHQYGDVYAANDTAVYNRDGTVFVHGNCTSGQLSGFNWEGRGCGVCNIAATSVTTIYGNVQGPVGAVAGLGTLTIIGDVTSTAAVAYSAQSPHDTGVTSAFYPGDITSGHAAVLIGGTMSITGKVSSAFGNAVRIESGIYNHGGGTLTASASGATTGFPFLSKAGTINLRGGVSLSAGSGVSECFSASGATTLNVYGATTNKGSDSPTNLTTNIYGTWMIAGRALGEYLSSYVATGSAVSLASTTVANITSISLTAGEWEVAGNLNYTATAATITAGAAGLNTTSATLPTDGSECYTGAMTTLLGSVDSITLPRKRITLTAAGTVYLSGSRTFSAGTVTAFGGLTARRIK